MRTPTPRPDGRRRDGPLRATVRPLCAAVVALAPAALPAQAPGATSPPALGSPKALTLPPMVERTLPNGLRLVLVEQRELPVVDLTLVVRTGSEADPAGKSGLATLTANLLDEGAGTRDALGIAEQVAYLAVRLSTGAGFDASQVSLHTTRATLDSALALMADVVLRPAFPEAEVARLRSERLTALLQELDRGPAIADRAFAAIVYGDTHPYGRAPQGTSEAVETITRDDAVGFWRTWYRPNNATLVIVGDLSPDEAERKAREAFGGWARADLPPAPRAADAPAPRATTIHLVDKPKAPQSSFRIGGVGVARDTPDYYPLLVMNTALGGAFTSRLNANLRETKGYTYGAGSSFAMRREAGPFTARAEIVREKSDSALIEFMKELRAIREPMPAEELDKAKRYLQLGYPDRFESAADIAAQVAALVPSGLPLSTLGAFQAGIGAVTAADVQRAAQRHLDPARLVIVIAGDREAIEAPLRATGIAPLELRDARGRPVVTP
jgi:predicted Zn-dependent peptidase